MLSMHNVSGNKAATYYSGVDDYYLKNRGRWHGKGAELLDLKGGISKSDFKNIVDGLTKGGESLIKAGTDGGHRAGTDLTFSAPKSVSLLGLYDDRIKDAHNRAIEQTLGYVEKHFSQTRIKEKGVSRTVDTSNLVIAAFQHDVSRELDPQLHTHCVVANMTQRDDGQWRALVNDRLYENKMLIGQIYRSHLSKNVIDLGYAVRSDQKGLFEVRGIDNALVIDFSKRKKQIDETVRKLKKRGITHGSDQKLREMAALESRITKKDINGDQLRSEWLGQLRQKGYTEKTIFKKTGEEFKKSVEGKDGIAPADDYLESALRNCTDFESVFTKEEVIRDALRLSVGHYEVADFEASFERHCSDKSVLLLDSDKKLYTTREMREMERDIMGRVKAGHDAVTPLISKKETEQFLSHRYDFMTEGQKRAVTHILSSPDRFAAVQGDAGTGKTTSLKAVKELGDSRGYKIRGLAYTGKAGSEMTDNAGIESSTLHAFLSDFDKQLDKESQWSFVKDKSVITVSVDVKDSDKLYSFKKDDSIKIIHNKKDNESSIVKNDHIINVKSISEETIKDSGHIKHNVVRIKDSKVSDIQLIEQKHSRSNQLWIVDESSMVGSRQMSHMIKAAEKADARVVLIGDTKQLPAIEAGRVFSQLQETGTIRTVEMKEVLRQKDSNYKNIVTDISEKKIDRAFEKFEKKGCINEITNKDAMSEEIVKDYTRNPHDSIIVTRFNNDRYALNEKIRNSLRKQNKLPGKDYSYITKESKNINGINRHFSQSYEKGDSVSVNKPGAGIRIGTEGRVTDVNHDSHTVTIMTSKGDFRKIDIKEHGDKVSVYREKKTDLCKNDKIVLLKNNRKLNIKNGETGFISSLDNRGNVRLAINGNKDREVSFNLKEYNYLDHGYAVTDYKSQGQTCDKVIFHAPTRNSVNHEKRHDFVKEFTTTNNYQNTVVLYNNPDDGKLLNNEIRSSLISQGKVRGKEETYTSHQVKSSKEDKKDIHNYKKGDTVVFDKNGTGVRKGLKGTITYIDNKKSTITVKTYEGVVKEVDVKKHGASLSTYSQDKIKIAHKDKIVFTKDKKSLNINKGDIGLVNTYDTMGNMSVTVNGIKKVDFNVKDYNYFQYGYCVDSYKVNGTVPQGMIPYEGNKGTIKVDSSHSFNSFYVAATRGKNDIRIYTDDVKILKESVKRSVMKSSTLDYDKKNVTNLKPPLPQKAHTIKKSNVVKKGLTIHPAVKIAGKLIKPPQDKSRELERQV